MSDQNQSQTAITLINVESMISSFTDRLKKLKEEAKQQRSIFKSVFDNNDDYQLLEEQVKKINQQKKSLKSQLLSQSSATSAKEKLDETNQQIREANQALSDYLAQYVALSGTNQLESPDGKLMRIIYTARLVPAKD